MKCICYLLFSICLLGCSRHDYITWRCSLTEQTSSEKPLVMILDRTEMRIEKDVYYFCGSLGNQSFFSKQCPPINADSPIKFIPKSGELEIRHETITTKLQCESL